MLFAVHLIKWNTIFRYQSNENRVSLEIEIISSIDYLFLLLLVPPRNIHFGHTPGRGGVEQVNITCAADHTYPEPILKIFHGQGDRR